MVWYFQEMIRNICQCYSFYMGFFFPFSKKKKKVLPSSEWLHSNITLNDHYRKQKGQWICYEIFRKLLTQCVMIVYSIYPFPQISHAQQLTKCPVYNLTHIYGGKSDLLKTRSSYLSWFLWKLPNGKERTVFLKSILQENSRVYTKHFYLLRNGNTDFLAFFFFWWWNIIEV